jgi:hypothetical protein
MGLHQDATGFEIEPDDDYVFAETDRAECQDCGGDGCESCGDTGTELTRDELADIEANREPHVPHWTDAWPTGTPLRDIFAEND